MKKIKKTVSLIIVFAMLVLTLFGVGAGYAFAATSGSCGDNATWEFDSDTGTLTITGTGDTYNYGMTTSTVGTLKGRAPWYSVRNNITTVVIGEGITSLGTCIFYKAALESVSLPSTLTSIGSTDTTKLTYGAFRECTSLKTVTMPANLETIGTYAFEGCTSLESVTLNNSLTAIDTYAFEGCTALKSITFPDSLTSLGASAFRECTSLKTVTYGTGLTSTSSYAFYNSGVNKVNFSSTITAIDSWSFFGTAFTSIEIPETVASIGTRAFANCTSLQTATIYNADCTFDGVVGEDPFNGSQQSLVMRGHSGSTTQTYAESKGYTFESIDDCDHSSTHEVITVEATCTEKGTTTQVCDSCGFVVSTTEIAATGHSFVTTETFDNTETDGHTYETQVCETCGETQTVITHNAFVDGYYTETNTATCTRAGIDTKTCTVEGCGETERTISQKTGHTIANPTVTAEPTCTEEGSQTGTCSVCNEEVTETIAAKGHSFSEDTETIDNTETDGHTYLVQTCTVCGEQVSTPTHVSWVEGQYTSTVLIEAQCVIDGQQIDTCSICGEKRTVTLPANGEHVWTETTRTEPTCTADGKIYYKCENCTLTKSENIEKLGHTYVLQTSVEPTCTAVGYNTYKCSVCGSVNKEEVSALGHTADESTYVVTTEADCETDGAASATCSVCGESYDIVLAALGHDYETVSVEVEDKPGHTLDTPTCTRCSATQDTTLTHNEWIEGYYTSTVITEGSCVVDRVVRDTCTVDGCSETRNNITEAVGSHSYSYTGLTDDGKFQYDCSVCGNQYTARASVVRAFWNVQYVNKAPSDVTNGYLLELNGDGVINAKDYAILIKAS